MYVLERIIIDVLLMFISRDDLNLFLGDARNTAILLGALIALSGALLGTFLLLRQMSMTSDAISHTVLLGIVVAFLLMVGVFNMTPDLSSVWLIIGAAGAGVLTVVLTEMIYRSGLVKQDAALGLAFPLLFAVAIILVARYVDSVHLDVDSVMVGEIGIAWANTNSHCYENCDPVTITPDDPRAEFGRVCINCRELNINPRDARAEFVEQCINCGDFTPAQAWTQGLTPAQPALVFFPRSLMVMVVLSVLTLAFVTLFYKELKLTTFDPALAQSLGFRSGVMHYALMVMVSLVAVGAFDAVGSILVVAFFIVPPATAYLLTDRLAGMLTLSPIIGVLSAYFGYDLARGQFFGLEVSTLLTWLDRHVLNLGGYTTWNTSISASIVMMMFVFFVAAWVFSPRYGLIFTSVRRVNQRRRFADQILLGHIYNHQHTAEAHDELRLDTLHEHLRWSRNKTRLAITRLRALNLVQDQRVDSSPIPYLTLTPRGERQTLAFKQSLIGGRNIQATPQNVLS